MRDTLCPTCDGQGQVWIELEDFEEKWEAASKQYKDKGTAEDADEVLKLALEKIKILSEIILYTDEA